MTAVVSSLKTRSRPLPRSCTDDQKDLCDRRGISVQPGLGEAFASSPTVTDGVIQIRFQSARRLYRLCRKGSRNLSSVFGKKATGHKKAALRFQSFPWPMRHGTQRSVIHSAHGIDIFRIGTDKVLRETKETAQ